MISVVIPAYQAEQYLLDTIRSAQTQTLPPSEIIVVDDGSTDRTARIAEESGVTVVRQRNSGVAKARNVGIEAARNKLVALLDADDQWDCEKLERQWAVISRFPRAGFVTGNYSFFDNRGGYKDTYLDRLGDDYYKAGRVEVGPGVALFERVDFTGINWIVPSPSALLVKKEVFKTIGYFDEELNGVDDTEFYLRAMGNFSFIFLEKPLVKYRQVAGGLGSNQLLCVASFLKTIERIAVNPELYPPGVYESALKVKANRMTLYGKALLRAGRFAESRSMLKQSWSAEPNYMTFFWWLASWARLGTNRISSLLQCLER